MLDWLPGGPDVSQHSAGAFRSILNLIRRLIPRAQQPSSYEDRQRFVRDVYRACLRREPDEANLHHWSDALLKSTHAEVLEAFLGCEEFKQVSKEVLYVPPGHFFSPIVDRTEAEAHLRNIDASYHHDSIPGISIDRDQMVAMWHKLLPFMTKAPFSEKPITGLRYGFVNPAYSWADGSILHAMVRFSRPRRLIEIGCGWSSACALDTADLHLPGECDFTFIEPHTELLKKLLAKKGGPTRVQIMECGVQEVPPSTFELLVAGDILFIDSTHVLRTGSDVCYELFEILPRISSGVLVHFHDVFWPFEYPWNWVVEENRSWNEVYAIRAFLTENPCWQIVMFNDYMARFERELIERTYPRFYLNTGGALWIQRR